MAGTNQFVPFATGVGSQVLTPAQWAASNARANGFVDGIADTASCNTAWRQSSVVAAMIGQFIVDVANLDANDDGNLATLENNFRAAITNIANAAANGAAPGVASLWHYGNDTGLANALTVDVSPNITAYIPYLVIQTKVNNSNTGAATINADGLGAKSITRADGTPLNAGDLVAGEIVTLLYDGVNFQLSGVLTSFLPASNILIFPASTTFQVPQGITRIKRIRAWGGGGGGGGSTGSNGAGSGGGGGGYSEATNLVVTQGQIVNIAVGMGGARGGNGTGNPDAPAGSGTASNGGNGGTTSVGLVAQSAWVTATGGGFGTAGSGSGQTTALGAGGNGMGPGLVASGGIGSYAYNFGAGTLPAAGIGGAGAFGGGSPTLNVGNGTNIGNFPGGGANGGVGGYGGGPGGAGLVIMEI